MRIRSLLAAGVAGLLISAAPEESRSPDELIRLGNRALLNGDLPQADEFYNAALERTADPGLVAFNKGAIQMRRGEWREAELNYIRCLDDQAAPAARRANAWYNRGVCLLARGGHSTVYRAAISCLEQCLDQDAIDNVLKADAQNNLEIAKLMWNRARAQEQIQPNPNEVPPEVFEPPSKQPMPEPPPNIDISNDPMNGGPSTANATPQAGPLAPTQAARSTDQKTAGTGTLPVLVDNDQYEPLSPEDARALLRNAEKRLRKDRAQNAEMLAGPERTNVRDW